MKTIEMIDTGGEVVLTMMNSYDANSKEVG